MSKVIKIRKGLDIPLSGAAEKIYFTAQPSRTYAVKPPDFQGVTPKLTIHVDDPVKAGTTLFFDKHNPDLKFSSPVSGKIRIVNRGERRKILEIVIEPDSEITYEDFGSADPLTMNREDIIRKLLDCGLWPVIRQRPYARIANPEKLPKSIFIPGFDTSPLAADMDFVVKGNKDEFQTGINALSQLTDGKIHLCLNGRYPADEVFIKAQKVVFHYFQGPHPAGNTGVHIHHIDPVNKGETVWYVQPQEVIMLGRLFMTGKYNASRVLALTGSEVKKPVYYKYISGASIDTFIKDNITSEEVRYISGNVLTGTQITRIGHVGFYDSQITVIPEGKKFEFIGWALPGLKKFSVSRTFFSWLTPRKRYVHNTNLHGGERAFVMTGEYERVLPMDIFPVQLLKSIIIEDIEQMEKLGIYEVAEEDLALCEFVCTSKIDSQALIRKGLDLMYTEME